MVRGSKYLVTLAAAGLLAAGCGTTMALQQSPAAVLAAAVTKTGTQSLKISVTVAVKSTGMSVSYAATGAFDFAHSRGTLTLAAPFGVTERYIAPKAYIKLSSGIGPALPHGKTWIEVDSSRLPSGAASSLGPFGAVAGNPKSLLTSLTAIASSERKLGTSTIRGVPVTGYQLNIDPAKVEARIPSAQRKSVGQLAQGLGKGTLPVDVYVDGQNLLRRVQVAIGLPHSATGTLHLPAGLRLTVTMDFYDFGVPVNVTAPPASQVVSGSQISGISESTAIGSAAGSASASAPALPVPSAVAQSAG